MKPGAVAASSKSGSSSTVAFSWEQEPGVSKQGPAEARSPTPAAGPGAARAEAAVSRRTPASAKKQVTARPHRPRVPPPPGGPGAPAASPPPGRRKPGSSRGVRPAADDPFLAAYLACTEDGANGRRRGGAQKLLGWAGLGLALGLGPRGLGLSCKSTCAAVEECVVRLAKIPPGLDED